MLVSEVSDVTLSPHDITLLPKYTYVGASSNGTVIDSSMTVGCLRNKVSIFYSVREIQ